jgi:hypothetical protein
VLYKICKFFVYFARVRARCLGFFNRYRWRAGGFFFARGARGARGARALAARARMFVTSQVPFFPNQQYEM